MKCNTIEGTNERSNASTKACSTLDLSGTTVTKNTPRLDFDHSGIDSCRVANSLFMICHQEVGRNYRLYWSVAILEKSYFFFLTVLT